MLEFLLLLSYAQLRFRHIQKRIDTQLDGVHPKYIYMKNNTVMIQLSPSLGTLTLKTNTFQQPQVNLPEITSLLHHHQNRFVVMNHTDMCKERIEEV